MSRKPLEAVMEDLLKQREEVTKTLEKVTEQIKERDQKREEEKLKAYGLLVKTWLNNGRLKETELLAELDPVLRFNKQRSVVGLPLIGIGSRHIKKEENSDHQVEEDTTPPRAGEPSPPEPAEAAEQQTRPLPSNPRTKTTGQKRKPPAKSKSQPSLKEDDQAAIAEHFN